LLAAVLGDFYRQVSGLFKGLLGRSSEGLRYMAWFHNVQPIVTFVFFSVQAFHVLLLFGTVKSTLAVIALIMWNGY